MREQQEQNKGAILVAFGGLQFFDAAVTAEVLYEALVERGFWLTSRLPKKYTLGMTIIFYQAGVGFRGIATLDDVREAAGCDWTFPGSAFRLFPIKLHLTDVQTFDEPVNMKALVNELQFVKNKQRWGHAVQFTPRMIPADDVKTILAAVKGRKGGLVKGAPVSAAPNYDP